jgi:uncharacterized Zn finger protein (UPF0148 family)
VIDQEDDIEDDVDAPKCKACGVPWTRHQGIIAICQQYLNTVEELEFVTKERDEARRWFCRALFKTERSARATAKKRNWDCFEKEKTP